MKSEIFCLVLMFLCVGCFSSKSSIQQDSRFKSAELKQEISYLIPLLKRSQTSPDEISIRILITPEFIYPQILSMNCKTGEYYFFEENFDGCLIPMYINAVSHESERFFDLNDLKLNQNLDDTSDYYCDDYLSLWARYSTSDGLELEKVLTYYKNPKERILSDQDTVFLSPYIRKVIPEPEEKIKLP